LYVDGCPVLIDTLAAWLPCAAPCAEACVRQGGCAGASAADCAPMLILTAYIAIDMDKGVLAACTACICSPSISNTSSADFKEKLWMLDRRFTFVSLHRKRIRMTRAYATLNCDCCCPTLHRHRLTIRR
jgi:hypothetical protein